MFAQFIRTQRIAKRWSVAQAAMHAGVTYWQWRSLEHPRRFPPPPDLARRVATALDCTAEELYALVAAGDTPALRLVQRGER